MTVDAKRSFGWLFFFLLLFLARPDRVQLFSAQQKNDCLLFSHTKTSFPCACAEAMNSPLYLPIDCQKDTVLK